MDEREMNKSAFMQIYGVGDVAKQLDIPPGTVRQWEKSLEGVLVIPRDEKGARYYTDFEIDSLRRVKTLRDKGVSFEVIRELLTNSEPSSEVQAISTLPTMSQSEAIKALVDLQSVVQQLYDNMDKIVEQRVQAVLHERLTLFEQSQADRDRKLEEKLAERDGAQKAEREHQSEETLQRIEESLRQRDERLLETIRTMQENTQREIVASQDSKKRKRFLGLF